MAASSPFPIGDLNGRTLRNNGSALCVRQGVDLSPGETEYDQSMPSTRGCAGARWIVFCCGPINMYSADFRSRRERARLLARPGVAPDPRLYRHDAAAPPRCTRRNRSAATWGHKLTHTAVYPHRPSPGLTARSLEQVSRAAPLTVRCGMKVSSRALVCTKWRLGRRGSSARHSEEVVFPPQRNSNVSRGTIVPLLRNAPIVVPISQGDV